MRPTAAKSIAAPGTPAAFATKPLKTVVVARPRIFGPSTLHTVPTAPAATTTASARRCGRR